MLNGCDWGLPVFVNCVACGVQPWSVSLWTRVPSILALVNLGIILLLFVVGSNHTHISSYVMSIVGFIALVWFV